MKTATVQPNTPSVTKTAPRRTLPLAFFIAAAGLCLCGPAQALILGINPAGTSYSSIIFDDTASLDPSSNPGITLVSPTLVPGPEPAKPCR